MPARQRNLTPGKSARHLFGAEMRRTRRNADMSLEALSNVIRFSKSQIARYETAESILPPELPGRLDACFGTDGIFGRLYELARQELHPDQFRRRMAIEAHATLIEEYSGQLIPGLVQTADYARALFSVYDPKASPEVIAELVTARQTRQSLLHRDDPPQLSLILDEGVIRRSYGSAQVMYEQLAQLLPLVDTSSTTLQVLPFAHGEHALAGGSMALLKSPEGDEVAWEEGISTGVLLEDTESVTRRKRAYDRLRAYALSPTDSASVINSAMEELQA